MVRNKLSKKSIDPIFQSIPAEDVDWSKSISSLREYYNYLVQNPFFNSSHFTTSLSIDYIVLVIAPHHHQLSATKNLLSQLGINRNLLNRKSADCVISLNQQNYNAFHRITVVNGFFKCCILKIHDPDTFLLKHLHALLGGQYFISEVEFSADSFTKDLSALFFLMKHTMTLLWPGVLLRLGYQTVYGNNIRLNRSKGVRLYEKDFGDRQAIRMEIVRKRKFFRSNRLTSLLQLQTLTGDFVFKPVVFKMFKVKTIAKRYTKNIDAQYGNDETLKEHDKAAFRLEFYQELAGGNNRATAYINMLLGRGDYSEIIPFDDIFKAKIAGKPFL
jgi:hypothetical protein